MLAACGGRALISDYDVECFKVFVHFAIVKDKDYIQNDDKQAPSDVYYQTGLTKWLHALQPYAREDCNYGRKKVEFVAKSMIDPSIFR